MNRKPNIKFNYLYRDSENYKNFGSIVFSNPNNLPMDKIIKSIQRNLIDGTFFYHCQLNIPSLYTGYEGPTWHEFENVEETKDRLTDGRTIDTLLASWKYKHSLSFI